MSEIIVCEARRRGRAWVASVPEHGVYGHGRTLKRVHEDIVAGLALAGVLAARVKVVPAGPELAALRSAREAYESALEDAVAQLAVSRASLRDMAVATGVNVPQVKRVLTARVEKVLEDVHEKPAESVESD